MSEETIESLKEQLKGLAVQVALLQAQNKALKNSIDNESAILCDGFILVRIEGLNNRNERIASFEKFSPMEVERLPHLVARCAHKFVEYYENSNEKF